jgi:hypothetical protein
MRRILHLVAVSGLAGLAAAVVIAQTAGPATDRSVGWARAREALSKFRATPDLSGLVEVDARIPLRVDTEDLAALCRARTEAVAALERAADLSLRDQPPGNDPITDDRRAAAHRLLGVAASFKGDMKTALDRFGAARDALAPYASDYPDLAERWRVLDEATGIASLRQGEIDNCLVLTGSDRCLFPLRPGGRHRMLAGATAAFERFRALAQQEPGNLERRWLLNLSAMLIGRHPEGVPAPLLLPQDGFRSTTTLKRFPEIARETGLGRMDIAGGTVVDDFDNDGDLDVFLSSVEYCAPARLFLNRGDGTFEERTGPAGLSSQLGGLNASHADYNNDGWLDLFIHRGGWEIAMRNSLLRNNGDGTFTDVTRAAGLSSSAFATHSAAWADYDNDGWIDLYVGHELAPSALFRNRGDGTFEDVAAKAGIAGDSFAKGVVWGDYDRNGYPDLYVSNMFGDNFLYRNDGNGRFTEVAAALGVQKPFASFPTFWFDFDNDAWLDLFVVSYPNSVEEFVKHYVGLPASAETLTLYRNTGKGGFENVTKALGLDRVVPSMGANFGDLDNDGYSDVYLGTGAPSFGSLMPNLMLRNDAAKRFADVTETTGTGHLQKGHGVAFADLDNDGDQDVVINLGGAVPGDSYEDALFENPGEWGNSWISLKLVGDRSNRAAIGARIRVTLPGGALRYREVSSGGSFGSHSYAQHIGLGTAQVIEELRVEWPASGTTQRFPHVRVNQALEIREGFQTLVVRRLRPFRLGGASTAPHRH